MRIEIDDAPEPDSSAWAMTRSGSLGSLAIEWTILISQDRAIFPSTISPL